MTLISREDAIEAVAQQWLFEASAESPYVNDDDIGEYRNLAEGLFEDVPSAEAEWIPCSERLPNEDEYVWYLVTVKGHGLFVDVVPFNNKVWEGLSSRQEVIAWKPLPMPYREDCEE